MKRLLLFLTLMCALPTMAQNRQKSFTFDFSNPESLTPSITRSTDEGGVVIIPEETVFKSSDGHVTISFKKNADRLGACIVTANEANHYIPYLRFGRFVEMFVDGVDATLNRVAIPAGDMIGGVIFESTTPATQGSFGLNTSQTWHEWTNNSQSVSQLALLNDAVTVTHIHQVVVEYDLPRDILTPVSTSLDGVEELYAFNEFQMTFADDVIVTDDAQYILAGPNNATYTLNATANGKVITLSVPQELSTLGEYTLTIDAGSFADREDYRNKQLEYTFTIVERKDTFNPIAISPEEGTVDVLPSGIVLEFPSTIGFVNSTLQGSDRVCVLNRKGIVERYCTASLQDETHVLLTFNNNLDITTGGRYTLAVPEKLVYDINYDANADDFGVEDGARYNAAAEFVFVIGNDEYPSDETLAKATALLENVGVGYPAQESEAYLALKSLVESGVGSDEAYNAAIDAYYAETAVTMPATGEYYTVAAVPSDGFEVYLKYDGTTVTLTSNPDEAAAFKATLNDDNTVTLATLDGKYLHVLASSNIYTGTSTNNITEEYNATVNNLTLSRLAIDNTDVASTLGLFSIYGSLGTNAAETPVNAYALVNAASITVMTDPSLELAYFSNTLTNAFRLTLLDKDSLPVPDVAYTLDPASGSVVSFLNTITIAFPTIEELTLADADKVYVTQTATGTRFNAVTVKAVDNTKNQFVCTFSDIPSGAIVFTAEKGAFTYLYEQTNAVVQTITANYTVQTGVDFVYDFFRRSDVPIQYKEGWTPETPIHDYDLNELTFYSLYTVIAASTKEVIIRNFDTLVEVGRGKFEVTTDSELPDALGVVKFKPNTRIEEGTLTAGRYVYQIEEATLGDANFGKYLVGDPNVTKSDCHVNDYAYYIFTVNNAAADATVGIADAKTAMKDGHVYDLQGRRMEAGSLRPGIYVKDGRKFVVK